MTERDDETRDPVTELRFALAEGDAAEADDALRERVVAAATAARAPGTSSDPPEHIAGAEVFRRTVAKLDALLGDLAAGDWSRLALRELDVQGLVGHLIGVEELFIGAVRGDDVASGGDEHVAATQAAADRQSQQSPAATHREWFDRVTESLARVGDLDPSTPVSFYGVTLPLDALLVVRAFEMWTHEEDVRRATNRMLEGLDPERLSRMVGLVTTLLPAGIARVGRNRSGRTARLVLTGRGGGTWDVNLDGAGEHRRADIRIVVDATEFCRVVGNRQDQRGAEAIIHGDPALAADVFVGAAALALD